MYLANKITTPRRHLHRGATESQANSADETDRETAAAADGLGLYLSTAEGSFGKSQKKTWPPRELMVLVTVIRSSGKDCLQQGIISLTCAQKRAVI